MSAANSDATAAGFVHPIAPPVVASVAASNAKPVDSDSAIGTVIGDFVIDSVIASGGMGTVYRATQQQPVRRTVALKMIRQGMADQATINRFMIERQSLALMDHPDIARVYEAGTTAAGNPYFAMEYCEGLPIDQYCDDHALPLHERIALVIRIARAVQRAHTHGIVHRDLKPANILVSACEGRPNLKIIDFGIAKFTDDDQYADVFGTQTDHATRIGEMIGTPAYMSPEQAAGDAIDGRTDVFAIGAILFKLLTGTTPLPAPPADCESLVDVILHIQSFDPVTPTRRLREGDTVDVDAHAKRVGLDRSKRLIAAIAGDLDWVTLRSIESDKLRRYATADDLADELQRYLNQEPVVAAGPSRIYRFKKFYQRRRAAVLGVAAVMATLAIALSVAGFNRWQDHQRFVATMNQTSAQATRLLGQADDLIARARVGGPAAERDFVAAQTTVAKVESLLLDTPSLESLHDRLKQTQARIAADQQALLLVARLDEARERSTQVDAAQSTDALGRVAGLHVMVQALDDFGVRPGVTPPSEAAAILGRCPASVKPDLIEALDFILNEQPTGAGLYLHHRSGQITIADVVAGGAADLAKELRVGDRILQINGVDLVDSFTADQIRAQAYRLLAGQPGTPITLTYVRDLSDARTCDLACGGSVAHWARDVLASLDADAWRSRLRTAVLQSDLNVVRELARSTELNSQPPGTLIQLSGVWFLLERTNDAIELLELAQRNYPANFWANHYLGTALAAAHDPPRPDESLRYLTAAVSLRPASVGARVNLVESLVRTGDHRSALNHAQAAIEMAPDYRPLQHRVTSLSKTLQVEAENTPPVPMLTALPPTMLPTQQSELSFDQLEATARELAAAGDRDGAMLLVKDADETFGGDPRVRRLKGVVLLELQDYLAARIALSDAARRMPDDAASRFYYGVALEYSGNSESAIGEYEAALQLRPDYDVARECLNALRVSSGELSF